MGKMRDFLLLIGKERRTDLNKEKLKSREQNEDLCFHHLFMPRNCLFLKACYWQFFNRPNSYLLFVSTNYGHSYFN